MFSQMLADDDHRVAVAEFVGRRLRGARVAHPLVAIDHECIVVAAEWNVDLAAPDAARRLQWRRGGIPSR